MKLPTRQLQLALGSLRRYSSAVMNSLRKEQLQPAAESTHPRNGAKYFLLNSLYTDLGRLQYRNRP